MYLASSISKGIRNARLLSAALTALIGLPLESAAQNVTSPYSILGIGDVDSKDYGKYFGAGSTTVARRESQGYNYSNPASLTALPFKTMHFDIVMRGRSSRYSYPSTDTAIGIPSNDLVVKRVSMAFRINKNTGIAFGLRPYSSVNYSYFLRDAILDGNTSYFKLIDGSGGINQFYFSLGKSLSGRFSAGASISWLFGSLQRTTQYISPDIALNITKKETDFYNGALFQGGIQYYTPAGRRWMHQWGISSSVATRLSGELTTTYQTPSSTVRESLEKGRSFKLPVSLAFGYTAIRRERLMLSVDLHYSHWPYQKVNYNSSYTGPSIRCAAGFSYSFTGGKSGSGYEKSFLSAGLSLENNYLRINNNQLIDYAVSIGAGKTITKGLSIFGGLEFGNKGNKSLNQIKETYAQYIIGLSLKDIWIGPKYTRRYS